MPLREFDEFGFYEDREGTFWIFQESGQWSRDPGSPYSSPRALLLCRSKDSPGLTQTGVSSMLEDRNGTLWVGTLSDGMLKFDRARQRFTRYRNDPSNLESLSENRITTLFEDREGHIWTGFHATEPGFFLTTALPFTTLPFDAHNPNNLGETLINVFYEDRHGILWIGTTGALNRFDRSSGQLTHFDVPAMGSRAEVLSVVEDPSGEAMWIGTGGQGLYRLDTATGRMQAFRHDDNNPASLSNDWVIRLFYDSRGRLWIGTFNGLNRFDPATGTFITTGTASQIRLICTGQSSRTRVGRCGWAPMVMACNASIPNTGRFTPVALQDAGASPHLYKRVLSLHVDHVGAVWAGTGNGLYRFDAETGASTLYTERDGLPSNTVSCIFEDKSGELWMGTSEGLSRLDRSRKIFKNYSLADGLPGLDFTGWSACFRGASGEMFFGGFAGGVAFLPENVRDVDYAPPMAFTDFQLSGVPVEPGPGSPLPRALGYTQAVSFSHQQNSFSIGFTTLSFLSPTTNRYRYRLEGIEDEWQSRRQRSALCQLHQAARPGHYRFQVQGATARGPWGQPGLEVAIEILPPWWGTWWFRALIALFVLVVIASAYLLRIRQIAHQFGIRLDERVNERTRIARELHDSLLQGFQGLMFRMQAVRALLPDRAPEAVSLLESALDGGDRAIAEGRAAVHDLRSNAPVASDLADSLAALGKELTAGQPPLSFRVVVEGKARPIAPLIRDDVYRIAREALRNAAQHSQARSIEVGLHYAEGEFTLRIRDDGIGIDTSVVRAGQRRRPLGNAGHARTGRRLRRAPRSVE